MTLYGSLIVNSTDTCSEHYCLYPININGNISYECILKHRKFSKYDSFVSILFNVNHEEDIAMHSFSQYHFTFSVI